MTSRNLGMVWSEKARCGKNLYWLNPRGEMVEVRCERRKGHKGKCGIKVITLTFDLCCKRRRRNFIQKVEEGK